MVEDRLTKCLLNMDYKRIDSNSPGIYLFYHAGEYELTIVSVIHAVTGEELTLEQYKHVMKQIKINFNNSYPHRVRLLSLILTRFPNNVKHFCTDVKEDSHWIIDLSSNRLMIYETQSNDFAGIKQMIEELLAKEQDENRGNYSNYDDQRNMERRPSNQRSQRTVRFTLINTIIIVINILVFIVMYFTNAFGGEEQMMAEGSLNWYFVKEQKEYYRILTSMFMHADLNHLISNMIVLLFIGDNLERAIGRLKYLFIYFGTGIIAGITSISYNMWKEYELASFDHLTFSIGASGAIFGVVGAMLFIVIINRGRLEDISTGQMVWFVVLSLYSGIVNARIDQAAHIGGFIGGLILAAIVYRRPKKRNGLIE